MTESVQLNAVIRDPLQLQRVVRKLAGSPLIDEAGRRLLVVIKRLSKPRSLPQNSLWHSWVGILADHCGCTPGDLKRDLKRELLPLVERVNRITGEIEMVPRSTRGLSKVEFAELMLKTEALASEHFGICLPLPNDPEAWDAFQRFRHAQAA